jgi:cell division protein FtsB
MAEVISLTDLIESRLKKQQEIEYYQQTLNRLTQKIGELNTEVSITTIIIDMIESERVLTLDEKKGKMLLLDSKKERKWNMANRYLCSVLDEMRECTKTLNFSYLLGLIEEAQTLANRMEAKLFEIKDFERLHEDIAKLKKQKKKLEEKIEELEVWIYSI